MPATSKGIAPRRHVLGVDGCAAGWLVATRFLASGEISVEIADTFRSLLDHVGGAAEAIIVDMPIGLADRPRMRACETQARRRIGARRSSVFPAPLRSMLRLETYAEANAFGKTLGAGLTKQAFALTPKIREIDDLMTPALQSRVAEGHPEVAFARLAGAPCAYSKLVADGRAERRDLLRRNGVPAIDLLYKGLRERFPLKRMFAIDDLYDACALALTAEARIVSGAWRLGDGARDARGLVMEISG
jgi:predicted RNase H-like nuclease